MTSVNILVYFCLVFFGGVHILKQIEFLLYIIIQGFPPKLLLGHFENTEILKNNTLNPLIAM